MLNSHSAFHSRNGKRRILIVEDEIINQEMLRCMLEDSYELLFSAAGAEALQTVGQNSETLSLILLDLNLPDMDGYEATAAIRAMKEQGHAGIPILAMTANAFKEAVEASRAAGMQAHIAKPIDVNTLMNTLRSVLQ